MSMYIRDYIYSILTTHNMTHIETQNNLIYDTNLVQL